MLTARRAAVLGSPVRHSLSPLLHRAGYATLGLREWAYDSHEVRAGGLGDFLGGLDPSWVGLSLTMPLKEEALDLATSVSDLALRVGAANTLLREGSGWRAENTDVAGIREPLLAALPHGLPPQRAAVLGSGATARAVLAALAQLGVPHVVLVVRDRARESTLAQARDHGLTVEVARLGEQPVDWPEAELLVSTTPPAASAAQAAVLTGRAAPAGQVVLDVVYADWPTPFARASAARGARVLSGVEMLVHQAAEQFALMTGQAAPVEAMLQVGRAALGRRD